MLGKLLAVCFLIAVANAATGIDISMADCRKYQVLIE